VIPEDGHGRVLQLSDLGGVGHLRHLVLEQVILPLGEVREPALLLRCLPHLRAENLPGHFGDLLLMQIPFGVARLIFARQALDVGGRLDVGELARPLLLKRGEDLRQGRLVSLPRLVQHRAVGLEHLALLGELARARALALGQPLLSSTRQGREHRFVFLTPA
jgi:hypothetical protein